MYFTDPRADMLTRMRNALSAKHKSVSVPTSKTKTAIAELLAKTNLYDETVVKALDSIV